MAKRISLLDIIPEANVVAYRNLYSRMQKIEIPVARSISSPIIDRGYDRRITLFLCRQTVSAIRTGKATEHALSVPGRVSRRCRYASTGYRIGHAEQTDVEPALS